MLCERRRGRRRGARGAWTGAATVSHPCVLRLIRNAAALAAARPTLLFNDWKNAARLNLVVVYYCSTEYKAVRVGGGG
jgi:hypothetical protein